MFRIKLIKSKNPKRIPKILRRRARPIKKITPAIKKLAFKMGEIMTKENGLGLAAPQVGKSIQLFVIKNGDENIAVINPRLVATSLETEILEEGCLSFPNWWAKIERPKKIKISGLNLEGKKIELEGEGYAGRALLHEIDHLNGILFFDHIKPPYKLEQKNRKTALVFHR